MSDQDSSDVTALEFSRRKLLVASVGALAIGAAAPARAEITKAGFGDLPPYGNGTLPDGVRSRLIPDVNGLTVNILEAGFDRPGRPLVLMLHGFPDRARLRARLPRHRDDGGTRPRVAHGRLGRIDPP